MMAGEPPQKVDHSQYTGDPQLGDFWVTAPPSRYSAGLKNIVGRMMRAARETRPTAKELSEEVGAGMREWMEDTEEGRRMVLKGSEVRGLRPSLVI